MPIFFTQNSTSTLCPHQEFGAYLVVNDGDSTIRVVDNRYKYSLLMHCIKIKSPAKFLLNEQYAFVGGNISFLCVLSCSSEEA